MTDDGDICADISTNDINVGDFKLCPYWMNFSYYHSPVKKKEWDMKIEIVASLKKEKQ